MAGRPFRGWDGSSCQFSWLWLSEVCISVARVNLSDWAHRVGVSKYAACRWYHAGTLLVPARRAGRLVLAGPAARGDGQGRTVIYARVWSWDQRADLGRQVARLARWATASGTTAAEVVTETGSSIDGRRRELARVLADPATAQIIAGHRDRLAWFGTKHVQAALSARGRRIIILDAGELEDDLVRDMAEVLTSFCARLHGRRGTRSRALRALGCAQFPVPHVTAAADAG